MLKGTAHEIRHKFAELSKNLAPLDGAPEKLPVGVYFHAGGFVVGNLDSDGSTDWKHYSRGTKLFTIGTSAGGALALEVALKAGLDQSTLPKNAVKAVVAFSPVVFHPANSPVQVNALAPAYIVTCDFDPLKDDGRVLAESMESRGLHVKRDHYESLPHCFWMVPPLPESKTFTVNAFQGIKWILSKMY
ncbi:Alpha/Beta hydrolase protein [Ilyonectria destructans]|nr:Alpha/Beta hydrolase protein [Ilyonectria destructans]